MKKIIMLLALVFYISTLAQNCNNAGFENGDFTGWTGGIGYNKNSDSALVITSMGIYSLNINSSIDSCSFHTIMYSGSLEPYCGCPAVAPNSGNYSVRLGGTNINTNNYVPSGCMVNYPLSSSNYYSNGEVLEKTINITPGTTAFTYWYQIIMDVSPHPAGEGPYFKAEVITPTGTIFPCLSYSATIDTSSTLPPGFTVYNPYTNVAVLPWQKALIDLLPFLGTNITIRFTAAGCADGGHFCYAYIDCSCGGNLGIDVPNSHCSGGMDTLIAPFSFPSSTYSWAGPGIVSGANAQMATANISGTYSVTVTNALGCSYMLDTTIVLSTPTVSFSLQADPTPHTWDAYPSYSSNVASALWNWGDGTSTAGLYPNHTYSVAAMYSVCVTATDSSGCTSTYCLNDSLYRMANNTMVYINVISSNPTTGIQSFNSTSAVFSIYPNPTNSVINIQTTDNNITGDVQITDMLGNTALNTKQKEIDVNTLPAGVYFVRVGTATQKFVKQ